jgi:hypothetical protein
MKIIRILLLIALLGSAFGQIINGPRANPVTNDASTGTVLYGTAIIDSAGQAIAATISATTQSTFIVVSGSGTSGYAGLAYSGLAPCTMDSTISSGAGGYYVINS